MVKFTPAHGLPYPEGSDSVAPQSRDLQGLALGVDSALSALRADALGAPVVASGTDLDSLTESSTVTVFGSGHPNQPEPTTGVLRTWWITNQAGVQLWLSASSSAAVFLRFRGSSGWSAWVRVDGADALAKAKEYVDEALLGVGGGGSSPAAFKTVPLALTVGGSASQTPTNQVGALRLPVRLGATVARYRVHIAIFVS